MTVFDIALFAVALLLFGYALLAILIVYRPTASAARPLLPMLNSEALIAAFAIVPFLLPPMLRLPLLLAFAARIIWEAATVAVLRRKANDGRILLLIVAIAAAAAAGLVQFRLEGVGMAMALAALCMAALLAIVLAPRTGNDGASLTRLAGELAIFPALPLGLMIAAAMDDARAVAMLAAFILVETFDSYALLGGKLFGRRRIFPRLSPNKTAEGLLCGLSMLVATALLLAWVTNAVSLQVAVLVAIGAGLASVAGDLMASRLKRASGVKDYPTVLPQQGGALDIADAAIMAGAIVALLPLL